MSEDEKQARESAASTFLSSLKTHYEPRDRLIKEIRRLRFMEREVYIPPAYGDSVVQIRTPLMNDLIQRLAGALSVNLPQVKVPPRPRGDAAVNQRLSTKMEKWTQAFLGEIEHQENDRIFYRFLDFLCGDGHGILKLIHRADFWDGYPEPKGELDDMKDDELDEYNDEVVNFKTGAPMPFSLKVIDPLCFFPFYSERGLEKVYEVSKRPKVYVAQRFNLVANEDGDLVSKIGRAFPSGTVLPLSGECEYVEEWTKDDVAYYVQGKLVEWKKHNYGRVPYFHALGTQTSSREPDKEGLSVGHQLIHLIPALDALLTMKTNSAFLQAYPAFKRLRPVGAPGRFDAELEDGEDEGVEFEPGHIYDGQPGEDLLPIEVPPVGQDVNQSIETILGIISKVGVPSVLEGMHSPNRVSGYAYSEMLNVSRTKYTTIIRNASFAMEEMIKFLWWLVEKRIGEEVYIWGRDKEEEERWLAIGPKDVGNYFNVKVIIEPLLPEDDIAQGQYAAAMVQAGMWSKRYARETKMGIPNPEEMDDEILVERAMEMPQVQMYLLMKALERTEQDELKELFQMSADQVMQAIQGITQDQQGSMGPGRPGLPNPAPGAGGPGAPGAPNPGANGMMNGGSPSTPPARPMMGSSEQMAV